MSFESHEEAIRRMIAGAWQRDVAREKLVEQFHGFYVACARRIFPLLPQEESRAGIRIAEKYLAGDATRQELSAQNWSTEGAAFVFDYDTEPDEIAKWLAEVEAIPDSQVAGLLNDCYEPNTIDARDVLLNAAYFADHAMIFPFCSRLEHVPRNYIPFLNIDLFQEHFADRA